MPSLNLIPLVGWKRYLRLMFLFIKGCIARLIWDTDTQYIGLFSGLVMVGCGVIFQVSDTFLIGNLYDYLGQWFDDDVWAKGLFTFGVIQVSHTCFIRSSALCKRPFWCYVHRLIALVASSFWGYIACVALLAVPISTAAAAYTVLAFMSLLEFIRSGD